MKRVLQVKGFIGLGAALLLVFGFTQPAHAYLDPGSGSAILQGIIAGFVAIGVLPNSTGTACSRCWGLEKTSIPITSDWKTACEKSARWGLFAR